MNDPKPDIMDGCGVSFWVIASLTLLLAIPLGIRACSDSEGEVAVDQLERDQRIRKIDEAAIDEKALRKQLTITLDEAKQRALSNYGGATAESNSSSKNDDEKGANAGGKEPQ